MRSLLAIVGRTEDGRDVFGGVYRFHETTGLPLAVVFDAVRASGGIVAVDAFMTEARAAGMTGSRAASKLREAVIDSLGPESWARIEASGLAC